MRLPARAVSSSADAPHVRVQLVVPGDNLYQQRQAERRGALLQAGARLAHLLEESGRRGRAAAYSVDAASRDYRRADAVSRAQALAARAADGLWLRERSSLSAQAARSERREGRACHLPRQGRLAGLPRSCIPGKAELEVQQECVCRELYTRHLFPRRGLFKRFVEQLPKPFPQIARPSFSPRRRASACCRNRPAGTLPCFSRKIRTSSTILLRKSSRRRQMA